MQKPHGKLVFQLVVSAPSPLQLPLALRGEMNKQQSEETSLWEEPLCGRTYVDFWLIDPGQKH